MSTDLALAQLDALAKALDLIGLDAGEAHVAALRTLLDPPADPPTGPLAGPTGPLAGPTGPPDEPPALPARPGLEPVEWEEPAAVRPDEAIALTAITGKNAWMGELMLWPALRYADLGRYRTHCVRLLRLDPARPLAICGGAGTTAANAVAAVTPDHYGMPLKPNETRVGGIDLVTVWPVDGGLRVDLVQVKLGGSMLYLGTGTSPNRRSVRYVVDRMRERRVRLLDGMGLPHGRLDVRYHVWTTRPVRPDARAWLAERGVALLDRADLWPAWPARVRAWAEGASVPDCPRAPDWLRPAY